MELKRFSYQKQIRFGSRVGHLGGVLLLGLVVLAARVVQLQVMNGVAFREQSDNNRIRLQELGAARGSVYDRNGEILAGDKASFIIHAVPAEMEDVERSVNMLSLLVDIDAEDVRQEVLSYRKNPYQHLVVKTDVSFSEVAAVEEHSLFMPGIITSARPRRHYIYGDLAGPLLGYLGEIGRTELEKLAEAGYSAGDRIGKAGVETVYESALRGEDGGLLIEVHAASRPQIEIDPLGNPKVNIDSKGRRLFSRRHKAPVPGHALHLAIDRDLQSLAESLLEGSSGAIVVMDANTGEIHAMASAPTFDPNAFVVAARSEERLALLRDDSKPLINRAIQAQYAPGSTLKIVMAAAGLETGTITPQTAVTCVGSYDVGGRRFRCWKKGGHGAVSLTDALAYSCDVYFYALGQKLGIDTISEYCFKFGFGEPTGLDLPGETPGLVPTRAWKRERFRNHPDPSERRWYPGETANISIGQGSLLATPLQMARVMAATVNGGKLVRPHVVKQIVSASGEIVYRGPAEDVVPAVDPSVLPPIIAGLRKCVEKGPPAPTGTGNAANVKGLSMIGKTGTVQVTRLKERAKDSETEEVPYRFRDHGWFVASVPDREPPLAVSVLVEHGGHGGDVAAPIAKALFEHIYPDAIDGEPKDETGELPLAFLERSGENVGGAISSAPMEASSG